jgi:hypothetical protein
MIGLARVVRDQRERLSNLSAIVEQQQGDIAALAGGLRREYDRGYAAGYVTGRASKARSRSDQRWGGDD